MRGGLWLRALLVSCALRSDTFGQRRKIGVEPRGMFQKWRVAAIVINRKRPLRKRIRRRLPDGPRDHAILCAMHHQRGAIERGPNGAQVLIRFEQ